MFEPRLPLLPLMLDNVPEGLRLALLQEGVPCRPRIAGAMEGRYVLFDSRAGRPRWRLPGQTLLDVDVLRRGSRRDPLAALADTASAVHRWRYAGLNLEERTSRFDKRAVRQYVLARLRAEVERAGGVWIRVAAYPFPYRTALNFRIDYDHYDAARLDAALATLAGRERATSHFVNGAAFKDAADGLARLRGLDVGSHGYWHHAYRRRDENLKNLARGIEVLRAAAIEPSGFVAPHGRFNAGLLAAMEELGISHSSEFQLAYDELPFFSPSSHTLQIPIHPVCAELFLEAARRGDPATADPARAVAAAASYFRRVARQKHLAGDPLFFYGHPTGPLGHHAEPIEAIFQTADELGGVWPVTLSEFGAWWRVRCGVRIVVDQDGDELAVTAEHRPGDYRVGIEYLRGRHVARMPLDDDRLRVPASALAYEPLAEPADLRPVRVDRPEGLKGRLKQLLDWECQTPVDEIAVDDWRGWAKRALRRLHDRSPEGGHDESA